MHYWHTDYKEHVKRKFKERFVPIVSTKNIKNFWKDKTKKEWIEFTDDDYNNICNICNTNPLLIQKEKSRVLIRYNETYMWCAMTKKSKIVKTIYPIDRSDYRKYLTGIK